jgi:hypothetical protein
MNDISDCPICLNTLQRDLSNNYINVAITSCSHIFCLACIVEHSKINVSCPLCRNEFLDPNIFGIQNEEEIIDSDIHSGWIFTSWTEQLREINEQLNSRNGIVTQNSSLDLSSSSYFGPAIPSEYFADIEDTMDNFTFNYIGSDFIEPEPEAENEPESERESEPEPYIDIHETTNQIYDYSITFSSQQNRYDEESDNEY